MKTPIYDFVKRYKDLRPARFHMPGHKGRGPLGCEELDLTEIPGADSLYEAAGIIAESELNASALFGCPTFYSTEGSSQCIRAMLLLAKQICHSERSEESVSPAAPRAASLPETATEDGGYGFLAPLGMTGGKGFRVLAARNVHRAFLTAAALLDLDVVWLPADPTGDGNGSYLSAHPTPELLDAALAETGASAVYLTCPDYLGVLPELAPLAAVCHARGALLLVDNAHGAYLRFLSPSRHPMDLGADLCCDSAHKTLPVLTGGAYLHVSRRLFDAAFRRDGTLPSAPSSAAERRTSTACPYSMVRDALALFGSTSPSYLILQSLDLANPCLEALPEKLAGFLPRVEALKARLRAAGWSLTGNEPLKLTLFLGAAAGDGGRGSFAALRMTERAPGLALAAALEKAGIFCEFADPEHVVFMLTPENSDEELERLTQALTDTGSAVSVSAASDMASPCRMLVDAGCVSKADARAMKSTTIPRIVVPLKRKSLRSIREAMLAPAVTVPAAESLGRVLARPGVSCPPAVPILMPGEEIDEAALAAFARYGIETVQVLP